MTGGRKASWLALGALLAAGSAGCVRNRAQPLAPLLAEGRANELRATAQHREERMCVWGTVVSTGLTKVERLVGRRAQPFNLYSAVQVEQVQRTYPYLYLRSPHAKAEEGKLVCYFSDNMMSEVAELQPNTSIVVVGDFQEYADGGHTLVLNTCELAGEGPGADTAAW